MLVKFRIDDGYAIIECTEVITYDGKWDENHMYPHSYRLFGEEGDSFKRIDMKLATGEWQTTLYSRAAYLMNDKGDTINAL